MKQRICIFGEVLFDHFPDGKQVLGGAPFNVAWNLHALGEPVRFISRVGDDPEGDAVRKAMQDWGMDDTDLQTDAALPTGRVAVDLHDGEPSYDIVFPCAYDRIQPPSTYGECRMLYHGSLALRDSVSRAALNMLMQDKPALVFVDVNLRPPWWNKQEVLALLGAADWVKLNTQELAQLSSNGLSTTEIARRLMQTHCLKGLVLTHGSAGAEVITAAGESHRVAPPETTKVVDAVGAGDAFASVMLLGLAHQWPLHLTLQRAQAFASALVGQRGATVTDRAYYQRFAADWNTSH